MFEHCRTSREGNLTRRILAIKQEGSYADNRKQFERYSAPIPEVSDSMLEGTFINRLNSKLKAKVESRNLVGLEAAMREAQAIDEETQTLMEIKGLTTQNQTRGEGKNYWSEKTAQGSYYRPNTMKIQLLEKMGAQRREGSNRRLSDAEIRKKRDKGLCLKCDEKYSPDHRCKSKEERINVYR